MNLKINSGISCSFGAIGGGSVDEEYKRIVERMLALGLTPTGNKSADKAKLHEAEMQQLKSELGRNGKGSVNTKKYVTISSTEIQELKKELNDKYKDETSVEFQEISNAAKNQTGAEQQALLNKYLLKI